MKKVYVVFNNDSPKEAYLDESKALIRVKELQQLLDNEYYMKYPSYKIGGVSSPFYVHVHEIELKED